MFVLDEEKLTTFLNEVASGFVRSPLEIMLFCVLVAGIVAAFILVARVKSRHLVMAQALRAREMFDRVARTKSLTEEEMALLERLGSLLESPEQKHLLLERRSTFDHCVVRLREREQVPASLVAGLRLKLGFKAETGQSIPRSTVDIPLRQAVYLKRRGSKRAVPGTVLHIDPDGISIAVEPGSLLPVPGVTAEVYFKNQAGLFVFMTQVLRVQGDVVRVSHAEQIRRLQRRKFYRKKLSLPVFIKPAGSREQPERTTFIDLGGGGASLHNPGKRFQLHDELDLYFHFEGGRPLLRVRGDVIRVSGEGAVLHVIFRTLSESSRDRIIRLLLRPR
ncbi:MAG: PilZ domain-containing protein [Spirochaetota bacterium]